ncbi:hypothetical protein ACFLXY_07475 [Chloroflexota bacterium]
MNFTTDMILFAFYCLGDILTGAEFMLIDDYMIKFNFSLFMNSLPGLCIVGGIALIVISIIAAWNAGITAFGGLLILIGVGLYAWYLYLRLKQGG